MEHDDDDDPISLHWSFPYIFYRHINKIIIPIVCVCVYEPNYLNLISTEQPESCYDSPCTGF